MTGADVYSHYLVKTKRRLKLPRAEGKKTIRERFDLRRLQIDLVEKHENNLETYKEAVKKVIEMTKSRASEG